MPRPKAISEHVDIWFQELIELDEAIPLFRLRRLESEISKLNNEYEKSIDYAYLYGIWGRFDEARSWLRSTGGYGVSTALSYAGAAKASLEFSKSLQALRFAKDKGALSTQSYRAFAFYIAMGVCAYNLAREIRDMVDDDMIEKYEYSGSLDVIESASRLGLKDEDIQTYFNRSLSKIEKHFDNKRWALAMTQSVCEEMPDKIVLRVEVPADPEAFGDILWDMCDIDYSGIPAEVRRSVIINPVPAE